MIIVDLDNSETKDSLTVHELKLVQTSQLSSSSEPHDVNNFIFSFHLWSGYFFTLLVLVLCICKLFLILFS